MISYVLGLGNQKAINKFKRDKKIFFVMKEKGEVTEYVGCMIKKKIKIQYIYIKQI